MTEGPNVSGMENLSRAEAYAYTHALLAVGEKKALDPLKGPFGKSGYRGPLHIALTELDASAEKELGSDYQTYLNIKAKAKQVVEGLPKGDFDALMHQIVTAEQVEKETVITVKPAQEIAALVTSPERVKHFADKISLKEPLNLNAMFGLNQAGGFDGKDLKLTGIEDQVLRNEPQEAAAARVTQSIAKDAVRAQQVASAEAQRIRSFTEEMAKHPKSALGQAMYIRAGLANVQRQQNKLNGVKEKFKDPEAVQAESIFTGQDKLNIKLRKQALLEELENSSPEVKKAYAFLQKHFSLEAIEKFMQAEKNKTFRMLSDYPLKHPGWTAFGLGYIALELLAATGHSRQKPTQANSQFQANGQFQTNGLPMQADLVIPEPQKKFHLGLVILKTTAALGAVGCAIMTHEFISNGTGGILSKSITKNLLNKMIKMEKTAAEIPR